VLTSDYISQIRELVHDLQSVDWTDTELITIVNNARQRAALDLHCVRTLYTGLTTIPNQEVYPINGGVGSITLLSGGSGYTFGAAVNITPNPPTGGAFAVATANVSGGVVTSLNQLSWGSNYTTPVTVGFSGAGTGASAIATTLINVLDVLSISALWPGGTNRQMLRWAPFTKFQAWCRAYTSWKGYPTAWTNHDEMNQIYLFPIPDIQYLMEWDAITLPTPLVNLGDSDLQVLQPNADVVQWYGAYLTLLKLQNFDQADYFRKMYNSRMKEVKATRQDRRIGNIYRSTFRKMAQW
jgi:hypothetical protein